LSERDFILREAYTIGTVDEALKRAWIIPIP
jgi:hypothetical protein